MSKSIPTRLRYTITGTGTGFDQAHLTKNSGLLLGIVHRNGASSGATAATVYVVDDNGDTTFAAAPADEKIVYESAAGETMTASATAASLNEVFAEPIPFRGGLTVVANTTAGSGALDYAGELLVQMGF